MDEKARQYRRDVRTERLKKGRDEKSRRQRKNKIKILED